MHSIRDASPYWNPMTARGVTRIGDSAEGVCYAHDDPTPWTGVFTTGHPHVTIDSLGMVRVGDTGPTSCGHTFRAIEGSVVVHDNEGKAIVRVGDAVEVIEGGTGVVTGGSLSTTCE